MRGNGKNGRGRVAAVALRCQPDSRLVGLVREGHDSAFEEIVRRYRAPLVTYAGGIVPDHHAEDVVQEALTRAHSALGRNQAEMNLKPWLFTIVRNGALNALRNEPVHVHLDENYDGVPQPPDVAARREELAALTAGVKDLPAEQREALVKRELEGRSHAEIATSLGLSAGAVRGLIYRARATLREGTGMVIPLPVLRALLSSNPATPEATGAAGAAAASLADGGGGIALKAGATLGVAVIAVGSGIAVQHRDSGSAKDPAATAAPGHAARGQGTNGSGRVKLADAALPGGGPRSGSEGDRSGNSGPGGGRDGSSGSSGPGPGGHSGGGGSSGPGSGTGEGGGGQSGSGSSGDDSTSGSGGSGESGDDGGGSSTSGHDGGGSGSSGSGSDDGTSGSSGDGGSGSSGSGSSGDGGGRRPRRGAMAARADGRRGEHHHHDTTTDGGRRGLNQVPRDLLVADGFEQGQPSNAAIGSVARGGTGRKGAQVTSGKKWGLLGTLMVGVLSLLLIALPGAAAARQHHKGHSHHKKHHKRHHQRRSHHRSGTQTGGGSTSTSGDEENAGTIASFDGTTLTITLGDGSSVSGMVTDNTEIKCEAAGDDNSEDDNSGDDDTGDDDNSGDDDGGSGGGGDDVQAASANSMSDDGDTGDDDSGGDDNSGDDNGEQQCTTADLTPGTVVQEAELDSSTGDVRPRSSWSNNRRHSQVLALEGGLTAALLSSRAPGRRPSGAATWRRASRRRCRCRPPAAGRARTRRTSRARPASSASSISASGPSNRSSSWIWRTRRVSMPASASAA